jgi:hypothetical protein
MFDQTWIDLDVFCAIQAQCASRGIIILHDKTPD